MLRIQYGDAGFDGCGPQNPERAKVGTHPAVLQTSGQGKRVFTTVIWPATLRTLRGRYGLSGRYSAEEMIALATTMTSSRAARLGTKEHGC